MRIGNFHYFNFRDLPPVQPTMWMYWYWLVSGNEKQAIRVFQIDRQSAASITRQLVAPGRGQKAINWQMYFYPPDLRITYKRPGLGDVKTCNSVDLLFTQTSFEASNHLE